MTEMRVYIANLGKYLEGESIGEWFTLPVVFEDVQERIGLNERYEEYAIHDYELPFEIDEYTSIEELNQMYYLIEDIEARIPQDDIKAIIDGFGITLEELADKVDDITYYPGLSDMLDLAQTLAEEGLLGEIPEWLQYYVDYDAIARDMEIEGNFAIGSNGIYEMNW